MKYPIFIPSKGRAGKSKTAALLEAEGLAYLLFVEKEEATAYADAYKLGRVVILPDSGRGLAYSRQQMLHYAREKKIPSFWDIDDDMHYVCRVDEGRLTRCSLVEAFEYGETLFDSSNIVLLSLNFAQFAWNAPVIEYRKFGHAFFLRRVTAVNYDLKQRFAQDVDYGLSCLTQGLNCAVLSKYCFKTDAMGSNAVGGNAGYKEQPGARFLPLVMKWGRFVSLKTKNGVINRKVDWKAVRAAYEEARARQ